MSPLLLLALKLFPTILESISGARSSNVTATVEKVVTDIVGTSDPQVAEQKLQADPALVLKVQIALAEIARDEKKLELDAALASLNARLAAEADARKVALDAVIEGYKAQLALATADQKAELDQRAQDRVETAGAQGLLTALVDRGSPISYLPAILSIIVTVGFFAFLTLFILMKNRLEAPSFGVPPKEVLDQIPTLNRDQIAGLFAPRSDFVTQIINICVGSLTAAFATVMSYWLGSSQGSRNKDALVAGMQERNAQSQATQAKESAEVAKDAMAKVSASQSAAAERAGPVADVKTPEAAVDAPSASIGTKAGETVKPAAPNVVTEALPELTQLHRHFPGSVTWSLTAAGISIEGASAQGTMGEPKTVRKIWSEFGTLCADASKRYGVPVELIVATIATESSGDPNARRQEPQINDESVGLMQTLVATARSATGRPSLRGDDLLDPRTSIEAGTAYIASQRGSTHFDPPLVAAAYNAGSLRLDSGSANRWKLRCFPIGTGTHIDRYVSWFGDAMRVSGDDDWSRTSGCPTFAAILGSTGVAAAANLDVSSPDFPPRPAFRPLLTLEDKQALFGKFDFDPEPAPGNPENIKILGGWEAKNIVSVKIPIKSFLGKPGPLTMQFHKLAKDQLVAMWLEWESAGLLDRILTYDGSFVPRFQRGSTTKLSNHAFGTAFDINASFNPLGAEPALMGEKGCVRELVPIANKHGFYWGGHFLSRQDGMHFEVAKLV
ncbi:transglycosylase SLT domain-containing protein [Rhizobium ruizarguesonis]|uniref:transglycosylase SLT domain-containing protein n=2 Tax=Rhizobium ruizarguesonis TaxID=2081791 RepID=UPI00102F5E4A|nr:transglycosylase SLT domain-containing protein [Rhizobium ruizarguesonis]TBE07065.1 hypothetical protein ELH12_14110 [Rhizobium ruizarguesonis]TBE78290.1 hypothetical protein ELH01_14285 [Rhizobium ruizarguesonis]TBE87948.1 hypothetical protein ELG99_14465 [Rhizobium ruizarguesonis]